MNHDAQKLWHNDAELYERNILVALNYNPEFWARASNTIAMAPDGYQHNLWTVLSHYQIFKAMYLWRKFLVESGQSPTTPITSDALRVQLSFMLADEVGLVLAHQIEDLVGLFDYIHSLTHPATALQVAGPDWYQWVQDQAVHNAMRNAQMSGVTNTYQYMADVVARNAELSAQAEATEAEFGADWDNEEPLVERIPLGFRFKQFVTCIGGGLGKSEHIIFAVPTGGGKTVLACQIAAEVALQNRHVLFITTEQHSRELEPRFMSANSSGPGVIPFDLVKDGGNYRSYLSEAQWDSAFQLRTKLQPYLHFENWISGSKSVATDLNACIEQHARKWGKLDLVILDWIGGALSANIDPKFRRFAYLEAATTMKRLAKKHNVAAISMAQATADAVNVQRITEKHFAECKTLHTEAELAFGISALRQDAGEEATAAYADKQYVYCFKSRKAVGKGFHATRNFGLQRWDSM